MRLKAFRIQNFRSILDTGFHDLSPDNITTLIGQNESGKTSILEALSAFDSNEVTEDDIRNDSSSPIVTCVFQLETEQLAKLFEEDFVIEPELKRILVRLNNCVSIRKIWNIGNLDKPLMELENEYLSKYFADLENSESLVDSNQEVSSKRGSSSAAITDSGATSHGEIRSEEFISRVYEYSPLITLFKDDSILPARIDVRSLLEEKKDTEGYTGAVNFLELTGISLNELSDHQEQERLISDRIDQANDEISREFQKFWSQFLGSKDKISIQMEIRNYDKSDSLKSGHPYLSFWIKDNTGRLRPMQRSKGVRWFISFFLTLKATAKTNRERVLLIDEPGSDLHAKAQGDILRILESEKERLQILYTTHSPYLLDVNKIHRVLAAERKEVSRRKTVTNVYKFPHYGSASSDTLFPLYTKMGVDISHQQVIKKDNNVLLEEISAYYYLNAFWKLLSKRKPVNFLPATGCSNIPILANLLIGWGISFLVVLDDDSHGRRVFNSLKVNSLIPESKLIKNTNCDGIEDVFEKTDFIKFVTNNKSEVIPSDKKVSKYVKDKKYSKPIMARDFFLKVENHEITTDNLSAGSIERISKLLDRIILNL